jgi:hypothetical protein
LVHQVGAHAGAETKEAQEHCDGDDDVKDSIKNSCYFIISFSVFKIVVELDLVALVW